MVTMVFHGIITPLQWSSQWNQASFDYTNISFHDIKFVHGKTMQNQNRNKRKKYLFNGCMPQILQFHNLNLRHSLIGWMKITVVVMETKR